MTAKQLINDNEKQKGETLTAYFERLSKLKGHKFKPGYIKRIYYNFVNKQEIAIGKDEMEIINLYRQLRKNLGKPKSEENGETLTVSSTKARTPQSLLKECDIDSQLWEMVKFEPGAWETSMKIKLNIQNENEKISTVLPLRLENRKTIGVFKKRTAIIDFDRFRRELVEDLKRKSPIVKAIHPPNNPGMMLEIPIVDPHLGKLAWAAETSGENYDTNIAIERIKLSFTDLLIRATQSDKIAQIIIPIPGDYFNTNHHHPYSQTVNGTPQEDDERWQKTFRRGRNLIIDLINQAKKVATVKVIVIPGNHDGEKLFYLGEVLEAKFEQDENVEIDNTPCQRKYHRFEKILLGFTHGKEEGEKRLSQLMQIERREEWGQTEFNEWHLGHIHHDKQVSFISTEDHQGLVIRYLRTVKELDSWETQKGFMGMKGSHAFIWNPQTGLKSQLFFNF